jgi:hypothetical protein
MNKATPFYRLINWLLRVLFNVVADYEEWSNQYESGEAFRILFVLFEINDCHVLDHSLAKATVRVFNRHIGYTSAFGEDLDAYGKPGLFYQRGRRLT